MAFLRFIASWLLAGAGLALINDVARAMAARRALSFEQLGGLWRAAHSASLDAAQAAVRAKAPFLWDVLAVGVLRTPAWLALAVLGALIWWLGRRRRRVEIYTN